MTDLRKAAEMALEALEWHEEQLRQDNRQTRKAIEALRQALAQGEQEPVAWWNPTTDNASTDPYYRKSKKCIPLYTAPPNKPWVSLTDEERCTFVSLLKYKTVNEILNAIEDTLRSKNNG